MHLKTRAFFFYMDPNNSIINSYLSQQATADQPNPKYEIQVVDAPSQDELDDFKNHVRIWMEVDNSIKKMQTAIKERNVAKTMLSQKILTFMAKFNIEDLNTKEGVLRYRVTQVKAPISQTAIKTKLTENYDPRLTADELSSKIFDNRQVMEKHSLRRISRRAIDVWCCEWCPVCRGDLSFHGLLYMDYTDPIVHTIVMIRYTLIFHCQCCD